MNAKKIIVAITGASGVVMGVHLLDAMRKAGVETHLIISEYGKKNIVLETVYSVADVENMATHVYDYRDMAAAVASGSFRTDGMIVVPCTIRTLSGIANSHDDNLIIRAADCTLKEKRRLVLVVRETPLHLGHIELLARVARYGGIILPPVPAFYHNPDGIGDLLNHLSGKMLDALDIEHALFRRWGG